MSDTVLVLEAHRSGYKHATANAALLASVCHAFPGRRVVFVSGRDHWRWVSEVLTFHGGGTIENITWRSLPRWQRWSRGSAWTVVATTIVYLALIIALRRRRIEAVLLSSVTWIGVRSLKVFGRALPSSRPVLVVVHQLNDVLQQSSPHSERLLRELRRPNPSNLRWIVLGQAGLEEAKARLPELAPQIRSFELASFWHRSRRSSSCVTKQDEPRTVTFGVFGALPARLLQDAVRLASVVREQCPRARFTLVGFVRGGSEHCSGEPIEGVGFQPLSLSEYSLRGRDVDYALWLRDPDSYRIRASASLQDALSFICPVVGLDSRYLRHCFELMGDIGYLCSDAAELRSKLIEIARRVPTEHYRRQCDAIVEYRRCFSPAAVGEEILAITREMGVDGLGGDDG